MVFSIRRASLPLRSGALIFFFLLFCDVGMQSQTLKRWLQPDSIPAMKSRFRTSDTTFLIGCYSQPEKLPSIDSVWRFLEAYGIGGTLVGWDPTDVDNYLNSPDRGDKWVIANANPLVKAAWGREIPFYLHADTAWSQYWVCKFYYLSGGEVQMNSESVDWYENQTNEQVYTSANTTAGDTIAKWITFDWKPGQTHRYAYPGNYHDTNVQTSHQWINRRRNANANDLPLTSLDNDLLHVVVTGHIFDDASTSSDPDNTVYLRIDVVHERPKGASYKNSGGAPLVVTADYEEEIIKTLEVTKGDLDRIDITHQYDEYREVVFPVDMTVCADGSTGPGSTESSSQRFDLRVQWTGEGKVAVRSVAVRDDLGQYLLGQRSQDIDYRTDVFNATKRIIYGPDWETTPVVRDGLIRSTLGDEPLPSEWAGFEFLNLMLRDTFNLSAAVGDSLPGYTAQTGNHWYAPHFHDATTWEEVTVQHWYPTGTLGWNYNSVASGSPFKQHTLDSTLRDYFEVPFMDVPSLEEHNGGRFNIPELPLDSAGVAGYTETLQRLVVGMHLPGLPEWVNSHPGLGIDRYQTSVMTKLGLAAIAARDNGRALVLVPGIANFVELDWKIGEITNGGADTTFEQVFLHGHISEPSELRLSLNLGLCYGGVGTVYYWLTNYLHVLDTLPRYYDQHNNEYWAGVQESFGPISENSDYSFNVDTLRLRCNPGKYGGAQIKEVIPDFFTGYKNRSEELIWLNKEWLPKMGVEMMKRGLRWRDAYSLHWSALRSGTPDENLYWRALPDNGVVRSIQAYNPRTGVVDPPKSTYVEAGFFYTKPGEDDNPMLDTNYVFLVNRRTFERPPDISPTSSRGRLMDTLAETRVLRLKLGLLDYYLPEDNRQYQYLRVRQIVPDMTPLPLIGTPHVLDTIIGADAVAEVVLGAGRACLLEITRMPPDESIVDGLLTRNNQRKIVYDPVSSRYYTAYHRYDTELGDWHVFFRRSIPMDTSGTILWEPIEWTISQPMQGGDIARTLNTHPSLTYRYLPSGALRLSVVWTAHPNGMGHAATEREVLMRDLTYRTYVNSMGDTVKVMYSTHLQSVGFHYGYNGEEWGTPVVSSAGFGDYVAWSDSTIGIVAGGRLLDTAIFFTPVWTPLDTVSLFWTDTLGMPPGKYPALPPFTHRALNDSSAGIVWQQQYPPYTGIFYGRLYYTPPPTGPSIRIGYLNGGEMFISPYANLGSNTQQYLHPSIDQSQDALGRIMEGVTWERHSFVPNPYNPVYLTDIFFRSILFDTASRVPVLNGTNWITYTDVMPAYDPGYGYPVVSSQNQVLALADSTKTPLFSVIYMKDYYVEPMEVIDAKWIMGANPQWRTAQPQEYEFGGLHPNGVASDGALTHRYAALYRRADDNLLRTSRQFFSRTRPGAYQAEGVEVWRMVDDSSSLSVVVRLYDVWKSDLYSSEPLGIASSSPPDSLHQMLNLLRSRTFETSDSVEIGATVYVQLFAGDSAQAVGKDVQCITELVDSVTGETIAVLDSTVVTVSNTEEYVEVRGVVDVLSGNYYVRLRLKWPGIENNLPLDDVEKRSLGYVYGWIPSLASKRAQRLEEEAGSQLRITAQPNPFGRETEVRFSLPRRDYITVTLYDAFGRNVGTLVERTLYDAGRYAVGLNGTALPAGTYMVELRTSTERVVEKMMVVR